MALSLNQNFLSSTCESLKSLGKGSLRFAPSPTGHFHIGNLRTALLAFKLAQESGRKLWIRFEDIDQARSFPEFIISQSKDMGLLGIPVEETADRQNSRRAFHFLIFQTLRLAGMIYPCFCSRKEIQESLRTLASAPHLQQALYSGHCRHTPDLPNFQHEFVGWRLKVEHSSDGRDDFLVAKSPTKNFGKTEMTEHDFFPSYHFACGVDDFFSHASLVIRAWDLEEALLPQKHLMMVLKQFFPEQAPPAFPWVFHSALVLDEQGRRLEKRSQGVTMQELLKKYQLDLIKNRLWASLMDTAAETILMKKISGETKKSLTLSDLGLR